MVSIPSTTLVNLHFELQDNETNGPFDGLCVPNWTVVASFQPLELVEILWWWLSIYGKVDEPGSLNYPDSCSLYAIMTAA